MATEAELNNWIEGQFRSGIHPEVIKETLKQNGSDPALVDRFLVQRASGGAPPAGVFSQGSAPGYAAAPQNSAGMPMPGGGDRKSPFFGTVKSVLFDPKGFFEAMPQAGGLGEPLKFAFIAVSISTVLSVVVQTILLSAISSTFLSSGSAAVSPAGVIVDILSGIAGGVLGLLVSSALLHVFLRLLKGTGSFEATFRVGAYSAAVMLVAWVPIVNLLVMFYAVYVNVVGYSKVHQISHWRVVAATLLLGAVIFILALIVVLALGLSILGGLKNAGATGNLLLALAG